MNTKRLVNKVLVTTPSTGGIWPSVLYLLFSGVVLVGFGVALQEGRVGTEVSYLQAGVLVTLFVCSVTYALFEMFEYRQRP